MSGYIIRRLRLRAGCSGLSLIKKVIHINDLCVTSPIPPSVNHYMGYRAIMKNGKPLAVQYKTSDTTAFQKEFSKILANAVEGQNWVPPKESGKHFYVDATFFFPRTRMDSNNYWKVLLDTITDTHLIWDDDDIVCERTQGIFYDKENPRIELVIHPVEYIGVFRDSSHLKAFESKCIGCVRYARNCKIFRQAKEGRIQPEINDGVCSEYKEVKDK